MTDQSGQDRPQGRPHDPLGSVGEEAAKLFAALADVAKDKGTGFGDAAAAAAAGATGAFHDVREHVATGGEDCKYCPVCQVIALVRTTNPEVKTHLLVAANSLVQAAAGLLATQVPNDRPASPDGVEKIDLSDGSEDWED